MAAAPAAALAADENGWLPLHSAAFYGRTAVVELLLDAAPETDQCRTADDCSALYLAARDARPAAARVLVERSAAALAELIADLVAVMQEQYATQACHDAVHTLLASLAGRRVLSPADWAALGTPCHGLERYLCSVMAHSPAEAAQLVVHLLVEQRGHLRALALSLPGRLCTASWVEERQD